MARNYLNETNANTYSNFNATNNFAVDTFPEYQDLTAEEYVLAKELNTLTEKTNKTPTEIDRQNYLVTLLESKIPRSIDYNNMASALINTQKQVKDSIVPYVESKKTEITNLTETKKTEINTVKDDALISLEQKKNNIIAYMSSTDAGIIRADIGVMGESTVLGANLIEKTNNLKSSIDGKANQTNLTNFQDLVNAQFGERTTILTASGTANAITLPITLVDKIKYSFKATANSTAAVTINGKSFKKLDGTVIGSDIKANKIYDFYYDNTQDCVFILAKAEGTATVDKVLAGETFSNGDDSGLVGTIPKRGSPTFIPSNIIQTLPEGYYSGGTFQPMTLTAGENQIYLETNLISSYYTSAYTEERAIIIKSSGTLRIKFAIYRDSTGGAYVRIYKNGIAVGIERNPTTTQTTYTEDFTVNANDRISLYIYTPNGTTVYSKDFGVYVTMPYPAIIKAK